MLTMDTWIMYFVLHPGQNEVENLGSYIISRLNKSRNINEILLPSII